MLKSKTGNITNKWKFIAMSDFNAILIINKNLVLNYYTESCF